MKTLNNKNISFGDYIFYCDSGSRITGKIDYIIDYLEHLKQDILSFYMYPHYEYVEGKEFSPERKFTKKDIFHKLNCNKEDIYNSEQLVASFILVKKTKFSIKFFERFLEIAQIDDLITDKKSNFSNFPDFVENRYDQSIFSSLYKINNLKAIPLVASYKFKDHKNKVRKVFENNRINNRNFFMRLKFYIGILSSNKSLTIKRIIHFIKKHIKR